jgi:hypothetical protein
MVSEKEGVRAEESWLGRASPWIQLAALLGIPVAASVSLVGFLAIPRLVYDVGVPAPLVFAAKIGGVVAVLVLLFALRACLALPSAPSGFYRNALDFLALARLHPAVKAALVGLIVLPPIWYLHYGEYWLVTLVVTEGWRGFKSGDVQSGLDGMSALYQLALTGGVPMLFALHLLSRSKRKNSVLLWLLVPVLFAGAAVGVVFIATMIHFGS